MKPIRTRETNFIYLPPKGMESECDPLPCRVFDGQTVSIWQPTPEERAQIAAGGNIALWVWGHPIPPVSLAVSDLRQVPEKEN